MNNNTFQDILSLYGFTNIEQQNAFKFICDQAGIKLPDNVGVTELLEFVASTQARLVNRKDQQERWDTTELAWMLSGQKVLRSKFKILGFVEAIFPQSRHYSAACVLGARMGQTEKRIKLLESLVQDGYEFDKIILLSGERYAIPDIDCSNDKISEIAQLFDIDKNKVTEARLAEYLFEKSPLKNKFDLITIDTPEQGGRRPTTQSTAQDFCKWQKVHPEVKTAMFISGQPHVAYQKAIISETLISNNIELTFEVIGYKSTHASTKAFAGALGSYIWACTPKCLRHLKAKISSNQDLSLAQHLYGQVPWLYTIVTTSNNMSRKAGQFFSPK